MCIVSIVHQQDKLILTHSRDEAYFRPFSDVFVSKIIYNKQIQCPIDFHSSGTWICLEENTICCILNGAYEKHLRELDYRMSRGLLIYELFKYNSSTHFFNEIELDSIEPFTLVVLDLKTKLNQLLIWDGQKKHVEEIKDRLFVRSSSTLYTKEEKEKNAKYFATHITKKQDPKGIIAIHDELKLNLGDKNPFVKTVCFSQIIVSKNKIETNFIKL